MAKAFSFDDEPNVENKDNSEVAAKKIKKSPGRPRKKTKASAYDSLNKRNGFDDTHAFRITGNYYKNMITTFRCNERAYCEFVFIMKLLGRPKSSVYNEAILKVIEENKEILEEYKESFERFYNKHNKKGYFEDYTAGDLDLDIDEDD